MTKDWDAIVVGAGHNGLTAAAYLGKAGLRTLVVERRAVVGGAAVTEEFHPGYRNSIASYTVSLLRPEVIRELDLPRHGYRTIPHQQRRPGHCPLNVGLLVESGHCLRCSGRKKCAVSRHSVCSGPAVPGISPDRIPHCPAEAQCAREGTDTFDGVKGIDIRLVALPRFTSDCP